MESNRSKYILAGLTAFCILLIGITSLKDGIMEPLRTGVGYFLIPIQSGVNKVGTGLYYELTDYGKLKAAPSEDPLLIRNTWNHFSESLAITLAPILLYCMYSWSNLYSWRRRFNSNCSA